MTLKEVNKVEQRFEQLAKKTQPKVWNNCQLLINLAAEIKTADILLSRRVLQRAKNLKPNNVDVIRALNLISGEIKILQQQGTVDDMTVTSTVSGSEKSVVDNNEKDIVKAKVEGVETPDSKKQQPTVNSLVSKLQLKFNDFISSDLGKLICKPWVLLILIPFLLFSFYQLVWSSPRYESRAQLIVQQPDGMATMDASMALLSGLGVSSNAGADSELVKAYVYSEDMLQYLQQTNNLSDHYTNTDTDFFSRLSSNYSREDLFAFYLAHTKVEIDDKSGVILVLVQAFTPEFSNDIGLAIVERAEWYINSIGHQLAQAQLSFIQNEHQQVESRLQEAKKQLLSFQQSNNLLDPEAEGAAFQQITYSMEADIASKRAELNGLKSVMTEQAPQVMILNAQLNALVNQLEVERQRLSLQQANNSDKNDVKTLMTLDDTKSVSEIIAQYTDFKIELDLALQAYTSSEISLEKSRIEAYRQLKYLVVVESSTLPEDNKFPSVFYNLSLFLVIQLMLFGIGKIIIATVKELN
ncbi:lipopolysaccharide biosynthesis protein [Shewanella sp. 6_MG-2023]|uniref:lipopolysaccharide biosynthesis protein n=1 Tax=Shewanella sp. 6_MG-2023 TaxID=3062660 RepID=UPI0026E2164E|nr:lipopolysaccharide biosynthesis protein [Shewanella sp. 6_MG-2023]MDO6617601.1 lipopolysaccharide biosynthesis protein [Shewanella sp. 6_MG-2023]